MSNEAFVDAIGAVIAAHDDRAEGRMIALGALQTLCETHLNDRQRQKFINALEVFAASLNPEPVVDEAA